MIKQLIKLANQLDLYGLREKADHIDYLIKLSQDQDLLEGGSGPILEEWDEILLRQERESRYPAQTYSASTAYGAVLQELQIECPSIRSDAHSSHGRGLAEWQMIVAEIDPRHKVYIPVRTTGKGVLDIFIDGGEMDIRESIYVEPEPGIRVKTRSKSRAMVNIDLSSRFLSLGKHPENNTQPVDSGFTIKNRSYDQKVRVKIEGACFPEECAGKKCEEWVVSEPQEPPMQAKEEPQDSGSQPEADLPREPDKNRLSESHPGGWTGEQLHREGPEGHPSKWRGEVIAPYEDLFPGDAIDFNWDDIDQQKGIG